MPFYPLGKYRSKDFKAPSIHRHEVFKYPVTFHDRVRFVANATLTILHGPTNAVGVHNSTPLAITGGDDREIQTWHNRVETSNEDLKLVLKTERLAGGGTDATTANIGFWRVTDDVTESGLWFTATGVTISAGAITLDGDLTMTGNLDLDGNILLNPLDPTAGTHVGDRDYNDGRYDALGTAAGMDHDHATPIAAHAAISTAHHTKYTDAEAAAKIAADDLYLQIAGDTMAGDINMGSGHITTALSIRSWEADFTVGTNGSTVTPRNLFLAVNDDTPASRNRMLLQGAGDIYFYKKDGSTTSLLWDESDDRWEFATQVNFGDNPLTDVDAVLGTSGQPLVIRSVSGGSIDVWDDIGQSRFRIANNASGDIEFDKKDGSLSLAWDESDDRWEMNTPLVVDQPSTTAAVPVLTLDQADVSEEMIEFVSTIGVGNAIEAVGAKTLTTTHFIKVTLPGGLTRYIPAGTIA